jgi:hypothetical protein
VSSAELNFESRNHHSELGSGDVAQRESTCLARRGSAVQIRSSPPTEMKDLIGLSDTAS